MQEIPTTTWDTFKKSLNPVNNGRFSTSTGILASTVPVSSPRGDLAWPSSAWWLSHPFEKYAKVKLDDFPKFFLVLFLDFILYKTKLFFKKSTLRHIFYTIWRNFSIKPSQTFTSLGLKSSTIFHLRVYHSSLDICHFPPPGFLEKPTQTRASRILPGWPCKPLVATGVGGSTKCYLENSYGSVTPLKIGRNLEVK